MKESLVPSVEHAINKELPDKVERIVADVQSRVVAQRERWKKYISTPAETMARMFMFVTALAATEGCAGIRRPPAPLHPETTIMKSHGIYLDEPEYREPLEWVGKGGLGDFFPAEEPALLKPTGTRRDKNDLVGGGLPQDTGLLTTFAVGAESANPDEIHELLNSHIEQLSTGDTPLVALLEEAGHDRSIFNLLKVFLDQDHGRIFAFASSEKTGHYNDKSLPPTISFSMRSEMTQNIEVLVHELMHYMFKKSDSAISESKSRGGSDHSIIMKIEERLLILDQIRSGEPPLHADIAALYTYKWSDHTRQAREDIESALNENLADRLRLAIESPAFYDEGVRTGMDEVLNANRNSMTTRNIDYRLDNGATLRIMENTDRGNAPAVIEDTMYSKARYIDCYTGRLTHQLLADLEQFASADDMARLKTILEPYIESLDYDREFVFSEAEVQDITYMAAYNTILVQEAYRLALVVHEKTGIALRESFSTPQYQKIFSAFVQTFATEMRQHPEKSIHATADAIMRDLIQDL